MTAPMKALMIAAIKPPPIVMPICGSIQPASKLPMIPTIVVIQAVGRGAVNL